MRLDLSVYAFDLRSTSLPTSFHADFTSHLIGSYSRREKNKIGIGNLLLGGTQ
jgi:hypothetical protein